MRVSWAVLKSDDRQVEAQIFEPDNSTSNLILFCPGFPGAGATLFEQRHAASLVAAGYALAVLRHAGTRLDTPFAPMMVNNAERLMLGRKNGDTHLGGGPSTVQDWLCEPLTALKNLSTRYENVFVIGNSFGALSSLWSLTESAAPLAKIRHLILLAGAQGVDDGSENGIMRIWKPEYLTVPRITEKVTLNKPDDIVATLRECYQNLPGRVKNLPDSISLTYLVVEKDELLHLSDTEHFRAAINGRGSIIIDDIDQPHHEQGLLAHDTPDYPTENLLALMAD
jgi:pimeloyl-ACP methyl ester carboxylesterase